jgi:hypothetical protein
MSITKAMAQSVSWQVGKCWVDTTPYIMMAAECNVRQNGKPVNNREITKEIVRFYKAVGVSIPVSNRGVINLMGIDGG